MNEKTPILLVVDDTLAEKEGTEFAHRGKLFDLQNLYIICNARSDSAMFEMPIPKEKPGPGRPQKYGKQIKVDDFELVPVPRTDYHVGVRTVQARIFDDKPIIAIVTRQGDQGTHRVFFVQTLKPVISFCNNLKSSLKEMHKPITLQI